MPPAALIAGGLVVGGVGSYLAGKSQADATRDIATSQMADANASRAQAVGALDAQFPTIQGAYNDAFKAAGGQMNSALMIQGLSQATPDELFAMDAMVKNSQRNLGIAQAYQARDEQVLSSIDPALVAAGKQAFDLVSGKPAAILDPIQKQRDFQRNQLVQQLQAQFGPGYASSSAGVEALNRFDTETATVMAQYQQQAMGAVGALTNQLGYTRQGVRGDYLNDATTMGNLNNQIVGTSNTLQQRQMAGTGAVESAYGNLQNLDVNRAGAMASFGSARASAILGVNTAQYAGGQYAGNLVNARNIGDIFKNVSNTAGYMGGMAYGSSMMPQPGGGSTSMASMNPDAGQYWNNPTFQSSMNGPHL